MSQGIGSGIMSEPVAVVVTATRILLAPSSAYRTNIRITNNGANIVKIGGEGVTYATGHAIAVGAEFVDQSRGAIYAICDTALTSTVIVSETKTVRS